jgi:hypothetical protein
VVQKILDRSNSGSTDWVYFVAKIMADLDLRDDEDDYDMDPLAPWPHSFIVKDLVQAAIPMAMFFPNVAATAPVTEFLQSPEGEDLRNSQLFQSHGRGKQVPDRRSRTSAYFRDKGFYK